MGIIRWIFGKLMVKRLRKDPEFISAVKKADESAENLRCTIRKAEENGVIVPDGLKKYAGMEIIKEDKIKKQ